MLRTLTTSLLGLRATPRTRASALAAFATLSLVLAGGHGCGDDAQAPPDPESLFAPGSYAVGFRQSSLTYARTATGEDRTLPLSIWYPAPSDSTEGFARYVTGGIINFFSEAALTSPAIAPDGPYPVVVYSHGAGGEGQHIYPYAELMASHGFIVVAPDHVRTTTLDSGDRFSPAARWSVDRPSDVTAVLDWLEAPSDTTLAGQARTEGVMLIGFSLGGYTTYASIGVDMDIDRVREARCFGNACELFDDPNVIAAFDAGFRDPRITAAVLQAAPVEIFADGELEANQVPVMFQTGELDISVPSPAADTAWERSTGPEDLWLNMPTGAHLSFIPTCLDVPADLVLLVRPTAEDDGCADGFLPVQDALDGLTGYAHMFARVHLLGETQWNEFLRGPELRAGFELTVAE